MVIDANLIPKLIEYIQSETFPHLQLEAAWAITNIASGSSQQTQAIIDKGGIPLLVRLLKNKNQEIAEQAIWALGNIAGDCSVYRDMILKCGGLEPLIKLIETTNKRTTVKHGTWAISNLCRGKPAPHFDLVKTAIPCIAKVAREENDSEVLNDACWALSYLSDGDEKRIQLVINTGVIPAMIKHLGHTLISIVIPALRTLGNIITGSDDQTNEVIKQGAVPAIFNLLNHQRKHIRKEACWTLSNITAGNSQQVAYIVNTDKFLEKLVTVMKTDHPEIRREAAWVLSNATHKGAPEEIKKMFDIGIFDIFVEMLDTQDSKTLQVVLEAINNILKCGEQFFEFDGENIFLVKFDQLGGMQKLEKLQMHQNQEIYDRAFKIMEKYFEIEEII